MRLLQEEKNTHSSTVGFDWEALALTGGGGELECDLSTGEAC